MMEVIGSVVACVAALLISGSYLHYLFRGTFIPRKSIATHEYKGVRITFYQDKREYWINVVMKLNRYKEKTTVFNGSNFTAEVKRLADEFIKVVEEKETSKQRIIDAFAEDIDEMGEKEEKEPEESESTAFNSGTDRLRQFYKNHFGTVIKGIANIDSPEFKHEHIIISDIVFKRDLDGEEYYEITLHQSKEEYKNHFFHHRLRVWEFIGQTHNNEQVALFAYMEPYQIDALNGDFKDVVIRAHLIGERKEGIMEA